MTMLDLEPQVSGESLLGGVTGLWSGKASRGAKSESPLQDDYPNTEDTEVWELQGRMPREDECQEWEEMAADRMPSYLGWSQVGWFYAGAMPPWASSSSESPESSGV